MGAGNRSEGNDGDAREQPGKCAVRPGNKTWHGSLLGVGNRVCVPP